MGGEDLGPEKDQCPSVGEYQVREAGVGGLVSRGNGRGQGFFCRSLSALETAWTLSEVSGVSGKLILSIQLEQRQVMASKPYRVITL